MGSAEIWTKRVFNREKQKIYKMPIIMADSGNPPMTGTNTLTIIIGDENDNPPYPGQKYILCYSFRGERLNGIVMNSMLEGEGVELGLQVGGIRD